MFDNKKRNEKEIGKVISVNNFKIKVLLDPDIRSQVRTYSGKISLITQIGGYLLFPVGPGEYAIGIIIGASEDETIEADEAKGMTLQLAKARRLIWVNLLGKIVNDNEFRPGITSYPALETPAYLPTEDELKLILEFVPSNAELDTALTIGISPIYARQNVTVSFNDLFGRPLGIIGNTGAGKSYSVASLIQKIKDESGQAKIIILDINGEYLTALTGKELHKKELNSVYVNGKDFQLPIWMFNLNEMIRFFEAASASQVPVLERVITAIREEAIDKEDTKKKFRLGIRMIDEIIEFINQICRYADDPTSSYCGQKATAIIDHVNNSANNLKKILTEIYSDGVSMLDQLISSFASVGNIKDHNIEPEARNKLYAIEETYKSKLLEIRQVLVTSGGIKEITADSPIAFSSTALLQDYFFYAAVSRFKGQERIQEYVATLRLRIHRQLSDKRWKVFTENTGSDFASVINQIIGINDENVIVLDCSMLSHDVLPFFCAVLGRILLELRGHALSDKRTVQPYVLVLEEAHNYLKPKSQDETCGLALSREAFERIAKEGRKFGLSLFIASQRPSDISHTILSQCANFLVHRIQNPDDIEYFKKILPASSRDLLDQLPILAPGDGLFLGSSVNTPSRVKIDKPSPEPCSETPKPWRDWKNGKEIFDISGSINLWLNEEKINNKGK